MRLALARLCRGSEDELTFPPPAGLEWPGAARSRLGFSVIETLTSAFVTFFVIVDPIGISPIFMSLTRGYSAGERWLIAAKGTATSAIILAIFAVAGQPLLSALRVSVPAFSIAGGILLFLLAIDMVVVRQSGIRTTTPIEQAEAGQRHDIWIFPLAVPLIAGPGAITSVVLLMERGAGDPLLQFATVAVLMGVLAIALIVLGLAGRMVDWLGVTGVNVTSRVFGIVLAALAVQLVIDGVAKLGFTTQGMTPVTGFGG